ncbi:MAG: hypothetical protein K2Q14_00340 [Gammaproteobacteria bacterium]|nr:hypothetical protein [Gammaproteobacteria bacterium]
MIKFEISDALYSDELENYVTKITGEINIDTDDNEPICAGKIKATYLDLATALNHGEWMFDLFEHHSQATYECYEALFVEGSTEHDYLEKKLMKDYGICWPSTWSNLLYIDKVEVYPAYRGKFLGLATINRLIQKFGHECALIVLKAFPLQFESDPKYPSVGLLKITDEQKRATKKLKSHYKKIGFHVIPKSDYMYYCPDTDRRPRISDLGFEEPYL